jgi:hypothetical protein
MHGGGMTFSGWYWQVYEDHVAPCGLLCATHSKVSPNRGATLRVGHEDKSVHWGRWCSKCGDLALAEQAKKKERGKKVAKRLGFKPRA